MLYLPDKRERHGDSRNPASYKRILNNPRGVRRLVKTHTTAHRILVSHDRNRRELDSCNSSDALLMNIFCHPHSSQDAARYRHFYRSKRMQISSLGTSREFP